MEDENEGIATWADLERSLLGEPDGETGEYDPATTVAEVAVVTPAAPPAAPVELPAVVAPPVVQAPVAPAPVSPPPDNRTVSLTALQSQRAETQAAKAALAAAQAELARLQPLQQMLNIVPQAQPVTPAALPETWDSNPELSVEQRFNAMNARLEAQERSYTERITVAEARVRQAEVAATVAQTRASVGPAAYDAALAALNEIDNRWPGLIHQETILGAANPAYAAFEAGKMFQTIFQATDAPPPVDVAATVEAQVAARLATEHTALEARLRSELAAEYSGKVGVPTAAIPNINDIPAAAGEARVVTNDNNLDQMSNREVAAMSSRDKWSAFDNL